MSQDVQNAYEEIEKEGLEQSENMAEEIVDKLTALSLIHIYIFADYEAFENGSLQLKK